ncbi:MAG: lipid-A-disaccharide synthase, partial [Pseudomonadota bacterium]
MQVGVKRVLIIAGEASADMHAANLVKAMQGISKERIEFSGLGGDSLISTGNFVPEFHNRDFGVYGLMGILKSFSKIYSALTHFKRMARMGSYNAAVLLDYPEFNLRLARSLKKTGVPVVYYISPQVWVWRGYRANKLRRYSKEILTIFPFEKDFYKSKGIDVKFVGHPVIDEIDEYLRTRDIEKIKRSFNIDG